MPKEEYYFVTSLADPKYIVNSSVKLLTDEGFFSSAGTGSGLHKMPALSSAIVIFLFE